MKASELRIGNYVIPNDTMVVTVIRENGMIDIESITYPEDDYCTKGIELIEPIPLTEEWLLKLGFECKSYDNDIFQREGIRINLVVWADENPQWKMSQVYGTFLPYFRHGNPPIEYVHQLQNLYFALTGEELTIKNESTSTKST